jgi:hypothetical protein
MKMRLNGFLKVLPDGLIEKSQRNHFLIMCPEHIRQNYNLSEGEKAMAGRNKNPHSEREIKPWDLLGISRATYYRRK